MTSPFRLETFWKPAAGGEALSYTLRLTNRSDRTVSGFTLRISGPARIDPAATIEGGALTARLSNHPEFTPPPHTELAPGDSWPLTARGLSYPPRHWTDGATTAYVVLADGSTAPAAVAPTHSAADNAPLKRGTERFPVPASAPVPVSVIPWPEAVAVGGRRAVPAGLAPRGEGPEAEQAAAAFAELTGALFPAEGIVRPAAEGGLAIGLATEPGFGPEAYRIAFSETGVTVRASTRTGLLYGLITLGQIWRGARRHPETFSFPAAGEIRDSPAHGWRGSHLDVARQFYSSAEVARFLQLLAWSKMNRFHWHLSDDEAWRVEIDAYPELTRVGAWRGHGLALPPLLGSGPEPQGGYYSKQAIRELVAQADRLGIVVVPEIDIPGHCHAVLQALPHLRDPGEHGEYQSVQGFPNNCLNPAHEPVYGFLETVFDELIALFPSKIIHVGADEVPLAAWSGSPLALDRLRQVGGDALADQHATLVNTIGNRHGADAIEGSATAVLQAEFLRRVQRFLASRGVVTGGWEEAAHGDVIEKDRSYLVGWRSVEVSAELAGRGYDIVVAPGQRYYLDMSQGTAWSEPGAGWAGWSGPQETYEFEATQGWTEDQRQHLMGVQACIWSEPMTDRAVFDRLVFPRLSAIAEAGWTRKESKSWARFSALMGLMPNLYGHWAE
ncbi:beta-N-acetylhexosaminidase [Inquilinus sp. Marseille-Q2685]|uniref:beta-N-acetylhexosaminidase n=1 Tax=Inquilinus sp. Marseille-Q2685 TaxID=2866581 RepID=UPI001CE4ACDF|nr:beta-N-acetylhexosaminidase [Inquilinus sp. Marseille-Q2685]